MFLDSVMWHDPVVLSAGHRREHHMLGSHAGGHIDESIERRPDSRDGGRADEKHTRGPCEYVGKCRQVPKIEAGGLEVGAKSSCQGIGVHVGHPHGSTAAEQGIGRSTTNVPERSGYDDHHLAFVGR